VFSMDFPKANRKDCYRIEIEDGMLVLVGERQRVCAGDGRGPHLAIAVSSYGPRDLVAAVNRDGLLSMS
jgi:hypothetical protein